MNVAFDNSTFASDDTYFLRKALKPLTEFLSDPTVVEISVNGPGRVFVERLGDVHMTEHSIPDLTKDEIELLATQVAGRSSQFVNKANPILSASLPTGSAFSSCWSQSP